jgi:pilus assembly protein FimV
MHTQTRKTSLLVVSILIIQCSYSDAAGFGSVRVQSGLGETLNINIPVLGTENSPQWFNCVKARVESLDGALALVPKIRLIRSDRNPSIQLTSLEHINEPVLTIVVEHGCNIAVQRSYQILLDPIALLANVDEAYQTASTALSNADSLSVPNLSAGAEKVSRSESRLTKKNAKINQSNTADTTASLQVAKKKSAKRAPRNVLQVSLSEEPLVAPVAAKAAPEALPLVLAPAITSSSPIKAVGELTAQEIPLSEMSNSTQLQIMRSLQLEIDALRSENSRMSELATTDKNSLQTVRTELLVWIKSLGLILLLCLGAFAWLVKRFLVLKKDQNKAAWYPQDGSPDPSPGRPRMRDSAREHDTLRTSETGFMRESLASNLKPERSLESGAFAAEKTNVVGAKRQSAAQSYAQYQAQQDAAANDADDLMDFDKPMMQASVFKAEEISDIMELVSAWMALHKPVEVLELLEPFNHIEAPESPLPWLCLLDVYNSLNDQDKYEAIGERIIRLFNVSVAPWDQRMQYGKVTLANFPRITDKILAIWDSEELPHYIHSLLVNDRVGTRVGFDLAIYRDLARLEAVARDPLRPKSIAEMKQLKACAVLFATRLPEADQDAVALANSASASANSLASSSINISAIPKQTAEHDANTYQYGGRYDGFSNDRYVAQKSQSENGLPKVTEELSLDEPRLFMSDEAQTTESARTKGDLETIRDLSEVSGAGLNKHFQAETGIHIMSPMAVKLNLGIAYQDIGDFEGANLLREEIIKEGTPEQADLAKLLLSPKAAKDA